MAFYTPVSRGAISAFHQLESTFESSVSISFLKYDAVSVWWQPYGYRRGQRADAKRVDDSFSTLCGVLSASNAPGRPGRLSGIKN